MQNSELKSEYQKERKRIQSFLRKAKKRGYKFLDTKTPRTSKGITKSSEYSLPKIPKKITKKSIEKLRKITPDYLYERSVYVDPETGELVSGKSGRKKERKKASAKAVETRRLRKEEPEEYIPSLSFGILDEVERRLSQLEPWGYTLTFKEAKAEQKQSLQDIWDSITLHEDHDELAYRLENHAEEIFEALDAYWRESSSDTSSVLYGRLVALLYGRPLTPKESDHWSNFTPV